MSRRQLWTLIIAVMFATATACGGDDDGTGADGGTGGGGVGAPCSSMADCRAGLSCVMGTCQATGGGAVGAPCLIDAECMPDLFCGDSRTCEVAGAGRDLAMCTSSADCEHEWVCAPQLTSGPRCVIGGDRDIGGACGRIDQCLAGLYCRDGMCTGVPPSEMRDGGVTDDGGVTTDGGIPCTTTTSCDDMSQCTNEACVRNMCVYTLVDGDDDGYASTVLPCGNDCSDSDPTVNPEHTEFMTTRHLGNRPLQPGTFDWNCDGMEELEFSSIVPACDSEITGTCIVGEGWRVMPEMCGQTSGWYRCDTGCTLTLVEMRQQRCR